jgi:hypothetical protein
MRKAQRRRAEGGGGAAGCFFREAFNGGKLVRALANQKFQFQNSEGIFIRSATQVFNDRFGS